MSMVGTISFCHEFSYLHSLFLLYIYQRALFITLFILYLQEREIFIFFLCSNDYKIAMLFSHIIVLYVFDKMSLME